jgi:hypothetical protein
LESSRARHDSKCGWRANLFANGGTDPRAGAACILALAQQMRRYQGSGVQLKVVVVSSGGVLRGREVAE